MNQKHFNKSGAVTLLVVCMFMVGCTSTREARMKEMCRFIRPDMMLSDANELIGWKAKFDKGDWYWTDSRKFIVHSGNQYRIVEVYDFYRFKHYHKLIDTPGVFESDIPIVDDDGNPINQW